MAGKSRVGTLIRTLPVLVHSNSFSQLPLDDSRESTSTSTQSDFINRRFLFTLVRECTARVGIPSRGGINHWESTIGNRRLIESVRKYPTKATAED